MSASLITPIRGLALIGLICVLLFNPISLGVWDGLSFQADYNARSEARGEEATYATVCPVYRDLTFIERWTTMNGWELAWCKNYLDRL